jgi:hypothetical protein
MGVWSFAALVGGGLLILAPFAWWLLRYNDLQQYWFLNWTVNANLLARSTIVVGATRIVLFQTGVCVLAATYLTALPTGVKRREVLVLAFATGIAPWFMRPPYVEYWLCFFPFLAILAAAAFVRAGGLRSPPASALLAAVVLLPAATWSALVEVNPRIMTDLPEMQLAYQLRAIDFVVGVTAREECVYDGNAAFNVFRKDVDYFWFGYQDSDLLETCKSLRRVEFDPYALVARLRPKVIGTNLAANDGTGSSTNLVSPRDSRIRAHYLPSESFATLLVRRDGAATGEKGVRQAIGGKPRLNFVP